MSGSDLIACEPFSPIEESTSGGGRDSANQTTPAPRLPEGYSALPMTEPAELPVLGLGAELKAGICLYAGRSAVINDRLGDLTDPTEYRRYVRAIDGLISSTGIQPRVAAHDLHPSYLSSQYARGCGIRRIAVQHHHAHIAAVAADRGVSGPLVGVCCDGVGLGTDGAAWGCEVLLCDGGQFKRFGHLEYFHLIGGDAAAIENWRPAAGLVYQAFGSDWRTYLPANFRELSDEAIQLADRAFDDKLNTHLTSSLGRVFDGVSFLLGLSRRNETPAGAATALERAATTQSVAPYPYETTKIGRSVRMSVAPMIRGVVRDIQAAAPAGVVSARVHESIARMLATSAALACEVGGTSRVVLSGGCFANRRLLARVGERLNAQHLQVLTPRRISFGDANIALGQAVVAAAQIRETR
jgi:hydrogenase maturation protein HypF